MGFEVEVRNVDGAVTALGAAGPHTLVVDSPAEAGGGGGRGFNGQYRGSPAVSAGISYSVEVEGRAPEEDLRSLVSHVDEIAEIPNSLRRGTQVRLGHAVVRTAAP